MNPRVPHHKIVMVARASIISESEVSITVLCLLYVHPVTQKYESRTVQKARL